MAMKNPGKNEKILPGFGFMQKMISCKKFFLKLLLKPDRILRNQFPVSGKRLLIRLLHRQFFTSDSSEVFFLCRRWSKSCVTTLRHFAKIIIQFKIILFKRVIELVFRFFIMSVL